MVGISNRHHIRCNESGHFLPVGSHGSGHCSRCDHLVTDGVAIPWDQPRCPDTCWDSFMEENAAQLRERGIRRFPEAYA
jgi:hypothetical protein